MSSPSGTPVMFPIRTTDAEAVRENYKLKLSLDSTEQLVKELFSFLDYTEESDSGRVFHPIEISSCRALMHEPLSMLLHELKQRTKAK